MSSRVDVWIHYYMLINRIKKQFNIEKATELIIVDDLLSLAIYISFIYIDLASVIRIFLSSTLSYEKRYELNYNEY
ncbi:hypothetical protein SAMN05444405_104102 [Bacteroides luti]|uniref:Uncharacterized protein n=1 Tax=Bacteroides luti TaxID=1297750 RepID=A0A1M4XQJ1_9BACE|nr:hypothetical protein SAMN05444405_104102 [Bacteroides luti]